MACLNLQIIYFFLLFLFFYIYIYFFYQRDDSNRTEEHGKRTSAAFTLRILSAMRLQGAQTPPLGSGTQPNLALQRCAWCEFTVQRRPKKNPKRSGIDKKDGGRRRGAGGFHQYVMVQSVTSSQGTEIHWFTYDWTECLLHPASPTRGRRLCVCVYVCVCVRVSESMCKFNWIA